MADRFSRKLDERRRELIADRAYGKREYERHRRAEGPEELLAVGLSPSSAAVLTEPGPDVAAELERVELEFERMRAEFDEGAYDLEGRA